MIVFEMHFTFNPPVVTKRFRIALTAANLAMNDTIIAFDSIPNSFLPISGTTVYSSPIIAPTNAFTKTRIRNC